ITVRVNSEFADEYAWSRFLDTEEINVRSVELVQNTRSSDRTNFTEENVKRTTLKIDLEDGTEAKRRITGAIRTLRGKDRPNLAGMIGLAHYHDEDFDEERIIAVVDGRQRKLNVTSGWPSFTYVIEGDERPTDEQ